jgi:hypothetical protein
MMKKILAIALEATPVIIMVLLIPLVLNDYILAVLYLLITCVSFVVKREKNDIAIYFFGLVIMTISETFFLTTGVETFTRTTLFGIMPIWLPLLWAYGFVAIKRGTRILEN